MKLILTDVDGVLTDGRVNIDVNGNETKTICYRDLDAIGIGRRAGYDFAFVTGEDTDMVKALAERFNIQKVYSGAKDKLSALTSISQELGCCLEELIYIGDSDRDAPGLEVVGLSVAPMDGTPRAKAASRYITDARGGYGVLFETVDKIISKEWDF